ncbi:MAG: NUDIX domain-containing protein [Patescibacteria group bacterium]
MDAQRPKVGVGILIVKDGTVLIGKRLGSHGGGTWQIPGGHLEFGHSFEETALREAEEETGLTHLVIEGLICVIYDRVYDKHFVTIGMLATWKSGEPFAAEPEKASDWQWFDPEQLPEPMFLPSKGVIEHWLAGKTYIEG